MNILGLDIGYSNLKLAFGSRDTGPQIRVYPSGAAPADRLPQRFDGRGQEDFLRVLVDGEEFVAGVAPDRAELWSRSLHADYSSSASYRALFHAGLLLSGMEEVDILVTGLPVSQYLDDARRSGLAAGMQGTHRVTPKRQVTVKQVKVIPQPVGGLLDFLDRAGDDLDEARILVIDPGFFSVDWVVIAQHDLHRRSSGTSLSAASVVLEEACLQIGKDHGASPTVEALENALRSGKEAVLVLGRRVQIAPYLDKAAEAVGPVVAEEIRRSLRDEPPPDRVVLVGGGARFFHKAVQALFPRLKVEVSREPVSANVRGFWLMGASL